MTSICNLFILLSIYDIDFRYYLRSERCKNMDYQDLLSGLVRLHVLHHAVEGKLYGQGMIEELARHGYKLSPGTLYPMLKSMETKGYLTSEEQHVGRSIRRIYRATPLGRKALRAARHKVRELFSEMIEERK